MSGLVSIHGALSNTTWLFFLIIGLWGLFRAIRGLGIDGSYMGASVIGVLLFVVQGLLGAVIWFSSSGANLSRPDMHILYGAFGIVFLPFVYIAVLRGDASNRGQWVMAFATLFLFGIALRGINTSI